MKTFCLVFVSCLFLPIAAIRAYHLVGGTMHYECVGSDSFVVTLILYRDCSQQLSAPFDNPAHVGIYDSSGNLLEVSDATYELVVISDSIVYCPNYPLIPCFEQATYKIPVNNLMKNGGLYIVYQRCCRNVVLSNIAEPLQTGATYFVHIPDTSVVTCNSSPRYNNELNAIICYGTPYLFDGSAYDPDGDSLSYHSFAPYQGASQISPNPNPPPPPPYFQIIYALPFTFEYPINSIPPFETNENSGLIAVTPSSIGIFLIGELVTEYRNGIKIGSTLRDFEWSVSDISGIFIGSTNIPNLILQPNPFSNSISLTSPFQSSSILSAMNSQGQIILKKRLLPKEKISLSDQELKSTGVILFRLVSDDGKVQSGIAVHSY